MRAITTKYLPATGGRGSRYKATAGPGQSVIISYSHSGKESEEAAQALLKKLGWDDQAWISGGLPDSNGDCFVAFSLTDLFAATKRMPSAGDEVRYLHKLIAGIQSRLVEIDAEIEQGRP